MDELRILSPTAILGFGFPAESLANGMARKPHAIAVDAGSTDAGPYFLGIQPGAGGGKLAQFARAIDADLRPLLKAAVKADIPLIIGSAGGAGGNMHLSGMDILTQGIAEQEGLKFRMALIQAEIEPALVKEKLKNKKITPLGPVPDLALDEIDQSIRIVAQMGVEPFVQALKNGAQVIIAGRASDPGMFAALPVLKNFNKGLSIHMGKILECGAIAAEPGSGGDVLLGTIRDDHFLVTPINPDRKCTVKSVAAHSLYEASDPWRLHEPGGIVDLNDVRFTQESEGCVRVSGSRFLEDPVYKLKLEGAKLTGYRTICIAGVRDPYTIEHLDKILEHAREKTKEQFGDLDPESWELHFRAYGKNGVMGLLETEHSTPHEIGLLIEAIAREEDQATSICMFVHALILHFGFPGRTSTAGNLAFPFSPQDIPVGPVHRFNIYHLMEVDDPLIHFPIEMIEVGND
ncbi:MAG: acyclic terpene utilization AtuA family protein [Deltaproteobacteria bacterium]|nr:acyclic terpene utilization AtuA family protein [Deltaproteobacteria bacterium]